MRIPVRGKNADQAPGVKRGGTVNIVEHSVEVRCPADAIPEAIDVDLTGLEINRSVHLSDLTLPENVRSVTRRDVTLVTIVAPSGCDDRASFSGVGYLRNSLGVTMFTRSSVHWADKIVATSNWNGSS